MRYAKPKSEIKNIRIDKVFVSRNVQYTLHNGNRFYSVLMKMFIIFKTSRFNYVL